MTGADLRLGRWQSVLDDVECDTLIVDAPYSERTHAGHDLGVSAMSAQPRSSLGYAAWSDLDVLEFVDGWAPRTRGWFVTITDLHLVETFTWALRRCGRYVFLPLPFVETGSRVRLQGDGPSSWTSWVVVARPSAREFFRWGTLPGSYVCGAERKPVMGGKPLSLMRALVRDYTRPGDLVCDPCAGSGTTLLAASMEGRRAVGAEMDPKHYAIAAKRLARGYTPPLFAESAPAPAAEQLAIDTEGEG